LHWKKLKIQKIQKTAKDEYNCWRLINLD